MAKVTTRAKSLEPPIVAFIKSTAPGECRERAVLIAQKAAQYAGVQNDIVTRVLNAARRGDLASGDHQALLKLAEKFDFMAFDAREEFNEGRGSEVKYKKAIAKARALDALLALFQPDSEEVLNDVVYETYFAADASLELVLEWLQDSA